MANQLAFPFLSGVLVSVLILLPVKGEAQDVLIVSGKIIDRKTKEDLPYASVSITNKSIGTISNEQGAFELVIPVAFQDDSLRVTHLGYKTFCEKISSLKNSKTICLEEYAITLKEVTIHDSALSARQVIEKAKAVISLRFPREPYLMEGFFRSWEKIDFPDSIYPGTLLEAAVVIYDPGYHNNKTEKIYSRAIRRSKLMPGWNFPRNNVTVLLKENDIKYPDVNSFSFLKSFLHFPNDLKYTWEDNVRLDGEELYVIKIEIPNERGVNAFCKVYVSAIDYAILRFELSGSKKDADIDYARWWHPAKVNHVFIFKRYENKVYLHYARIDYNMRKIDPRKKKAFELETYHKELLVTSVVVEDVEARSKLLGEEITKKPLELQPKTYDEDFWKKYIMIKENAVDREIITWFEQHEKLEAQFKTAK
jgi:hypothetical protein